MKGKLNVAEVNCEVHKAVCQAQNVQGYPTLNYYTGGTGPSLHKTEYTGGRKLDQMQSFAEMAVAPFVFYYHQMFFHADWFYRPVREVKSESDYEYYVNELPVLYLFLYNPKNKQALV